MTQDFAANLIEIFGTKYVIYISVLLFFYFYII